MTPLRFGPSPHLLLVRTDKIGDLILTTPALMALRAAYPKAHIGFLCRSYSAPVLENNPAVNIIIPSDAEGESFWNLAKKIRKERFDASIHFYAEPRSILLTALAGIPLRVGPFSKIASLLLNRRIAQNRSEARKHEAEYNFDLARYCGANGAVPKPVIFLKDEEKKAGKDWILKTVKNPSQRPVMIHPGSAGSAKNWPLEQYLVLAQRIVGELGEVIFTAGPGEEWIVKKVQNLMNNRIHVFYGKDLPLRLLAGVISEARLMVSNSTGPLHMAVALGVPTCSVYPLLPEVTSPKRWGPLGDPAANAVLTPESGTQEMSTISVDRALDAILKLPARSGF